MANPTEAWPTNAVLDALNGTIDGDTGLPYLLENTTPESDPPLSRAVDRRWHRQNLLLAELAAGRVVKVDDTHIGIFGAHFRLGNNDYQYSGEASVAIGTDDVYYIWLDSGSDDGSDDGVGSAVDGTGWPTDPYSYIPLAEVTRAAGAITGIVDVRNRSKLVTPPPTLIAGKTTSAADSLAIPVTHSTVEKTTGVDAEALTLANGEPGQILTIVLATDGGGDGTLTPTTMTAFATIVFADAGDTATLMFVDDTVGWVILGTAGVAAPPVISV